MTKSTLVFFLFIFSSSISLFATGSSRIYSQNVVCTGGTGIIDNYITNTSATTSTNYIATATISSDPAALVTTGISPVGTIRVNRLTSSLHYVVIQLANISTTTPWAAGDTIHVTVTWNGGGAFVGQTTNWYFTVPTGTAAITVNSPTQTVPPLLPPVDPNPTLSTTPIPADASVGIPITTTQISWTNTHNSAFTDPTGYKVYFGAGELPSSYTYVAGCVGNFSMPVTLENGIVYHWKVVPTTTTAKGPGISESRDQTITRGDAVGAVEWTFTTVVIPPLQAINPNPINNQLLQWTGEQTQTLSWQSNTQGPPPSGYMISWDGIAPVDIGNVTSWTTPLLTCTNYKWKIIPYNVVNGQFAYADSTQCPWWFFGMAAPHATYSVSSIPFGLVWTNHQASLPVSISNIGNADLEIDLLLAAGAYSIINHPASFIVSPNQTEIINIGFTPIATQGYNKSLFIETNDPRNTNVIIPLTGTGYILTADFEPSTYSGDLPLTINFTDHSSTTVHTWSWDFGDGNTSILQNPEHIFTTKGSKNVTVTVYDTYFNRSITKTITVIAHPLLECSNQNHDFGTEYLGTTTESTVTINSIGTDSLLVTSIHWKSGNPALNVNSVDIMKGILPGNSALINVSFAPISTASISDTLIIETDAENIPIIKFKFSGKGAYVPPKVPENLQISMNGSDAQLSWDAVTQTIFDTPIVPDYYFVYFNGSNVETGPFYFLGLSHSLTYQHNDVGIGSEYMFYRVKAIKVFTRNDEFLNEIKPGMTESEVNNILVKYE